MNGTKRKFEELLPHEILAFTKGASIAFLPIGSMEWHGPHMSMGMDTAHAYAVALGLAETMNGTALPPLYIGTEQPRTSDMLKKVGFSGTESVVGMDFPANTVKSMYWPEELFSAVVRQQALFLIELGFRTVVFVNGHGADNQIIALERIAACRVGALPRTGRTLPHGAAESRAGVLQQARKKGRRAPGAGSGFRA